MLVFTWVSSSEPLSSADVGTVQQRSSDLYAMNLRNLDATATATDIAVTLDDGGSGVLDGQWLLSLDGVSFTASLAIGAIRPGQYRQLWIRRATPSDAPTGRNFSITLRAAAGSWTS